MEMMATERVCMFTATSATPFWRYNTHSLSILSFLFCGDEAEASYDII